MPNWCDNTFSILARKEINDEIKNDVNTHMGRHFEDARVHETILPYSHKEQIWSYLYISVRTAYGPPADFINFVVENFQDVHLKGHYWIEGGDGAADFEISSDKEGKVYYLSYDEINQEYMTEEEIEEMIEQVSLEELRFDQSKIENDRDFL